MDPSRKRRIRLGVALTAAVLLAAGLVYTSFSTSSESVEPSQLTASAVPGRTYELTGKVKAGTVERSGDVLRFQVENRKGGGTAVPVEYRGAVPDPFREGREVVIRVSKQGTTWIGAKDSLITKCPSKYQAQDTPS